MSIKVTKLDSGLRIITDSVPEMETVALGVWADVGTRHEDLKHNGVAHMVEHMMFKGTSKLGTLNWEKEKELLQKISDLYEQHKAETDPQKKKEIL